jgi:hypothetical protein
MIHGNGLNILSHISTIHFASWGHAVAQLVEALRCKPEGREYVSRWYLWNLSLA